MHGVIVCTYVHPSQHGPANGGFSGKARLGGLARLLANPVSTATNAYRCEHAAFSKIVRGKLDEFSIDYLAGPVARTGHALASVKGRCHPDNPFRMNSNIKPA